MSGARDSGAPVPGAPESEAASGEATRAYGGEEGEPASETAEVSAEPDRGSVVRGPLDSELPQGYFLCN